MKDAFIDTQNTKQISIVGKLIIKNKEKEKNKLKGKQTEIYFNYQ